MILFNYSVCNWTSNVLTGNTHYCSFLLLFLPFFLRAFCPSFLPHPHLLSPSFHLHSLLFFSSHPNTNPSPLPLHLLPLTHPQLLLLLLLLLLPLLCHLSGLRREQLLLTEQRCRLRLMELHWHLVVKCQNCNRTWHEDRFRKVICRGSWKQNFYFNNDTYDDLNCLDTSSEHNARFEVIRVSVFTSSVPLNVVWLLV